MDMRIMLDSEWNWLVDLTDGDDAKIHWHNMFSWVDDPENKRVLPMTCRVYRGHKSARYWDFNSASYQRTDLGFRPVCIPTSKTLFPEIKEGGSTVIGTLYMGGKPVKVPQVPTQKGDITNYTPGFSLEMREPLEDPAYQVTGIRVGKVFIADRCLLKCISYEDIESAIFTTNTLTASAIIKRLQSMMERAGGDPKVVFESDEWTDDLEETKFQERFLNGITLEGGTVYIRTER